MTSKFHNTSNIVRECRVFEHKISLPLTIQKRQEKTTIFGYFVPVEKDMWQGVSLLSLQQLEELIVFSTDAGSFILAKKPYLSQPLSSFPLTLVTHNPLLFISTSYEIKLPLHSQINMPTSFDSDSTVIGFDDGQNFTWYYFAKEQEKSIGQLMYLKTPLQVFRPMTKMIETSFIEPPSFIETDLPDSKKWNEKPNSWFFEDNSFAAQKFRQFWQWIGERYSFLRLVTTKNSKAKKLSKSKQFLLWLFRKIYQLWLWIGKTFFPFSLSKFSLKDSTQGSLRQYLEKQNALLEKLADLLEQGELSSALAHAIPLSKNFGTAMKEHDLLAADWQLPQNAILYSQEKIDKKHKQGSVFIGEALLKRLIWNYHQAGKALLHQGKYSEAAYVYSYLLKDYKMAAYCLAKGGMYLEAAGLWVNQLENKKKASELLIEGGLIHEAARIYLKDNNYEQATTIYQQAQMPLELQNCLRNWIDYLVSQKRYLEAGDLMKSRIQNRLEAVTLFQKAAENIREMGGAYARLWTCQNFSWQQVNHKLDKMIEEYPPGIFVDNIIQFTSYVRANNDQVINISQKKELKNRLVDLLLKLIIYHPKSSSIILNELGKLIPPELDPFFINDLTRGIAQRKRKYQGPLCMEESFINFLYLPSQTEMILCDNQTIHKFYTQDEYRYDHSLTKIQKILGTATGDLFCQSDNELFYLGGKLQEFIRHKVLPKKVVDFALVNKQLIVLTQEEQEANLYLVELSPSFSFRLIHSWKEAPIQAFTFWSLRDQIIIHTKENMKIFTLDFDNETTVRYLTSFFASGQILQNTKASHDVVVGYNPKEQVWKALKWRSGKLHFYLLDFPSESITDFFLHCSEVSTLLVSVHENAQLKFTQFISNDFITQATRSCTLPMHEITSSCVFGQEIFCTDAEGSIWAVHLQNGSRRLVSYRKMP